MAVEPFMASLEALQAEVATAKNRVWTRVADGTLSLELLRRLCKEYYFLGKWYTSEFGCLVASAPDVDALNLGSSEHFAHWSQNLADEMGYGGDRNHVDMKVDWAHQLGISDEELVSYRPMPETIGSVFTSLFYMRRSYEEGLAAFGWAGERFAASTNYAVMMFEGMRDHYGMEVENFKVHAYAEEDHGREADYLLRQVAVTAGQQRRIRRAIEHVLILRNARTLALNSWLDESGALHD
jgi:pyrroloquinoline quinone (PQQ) biosynthesis protein C